MSALVEYGVAEDPEGWRPRVWVDGAEEPDYGRREATPEAAVDVASEYAIHLAEKYLGQGGVEIRLRVEPATPPVLGPESTIAELSAECVRLDISEVGVWKAPRPEDGWRARVWKVAAAEPVFGHQPDPMSALLEALRRANGGL